MFDPVTEAIIKGSRALTGLDPSTLAEELTNVHIEIAAARLALSAPNDESSGYLKEALKRLSRLADAYEAEIILGLNPGFTKSMAFVAASARQAIAQATRPLGNTPMRAPLDEYSVGPDVSSALLYLIAERSSDAFEAARFIETPEYSTKYSDGVAVAIRNYAQGDLKRLVSTSANVLALDVEDFDPAEILFREILKGLALLGNIGLGQLASSEIDAAKDFFRTVLKLSVESTLLDEFPDSNIIFNSIFSGPRHVAALLIRVADGLKESAVVFLPAPSGADSKVWENWLKSEAATWPFLWESHREAISLGYLDVGNSLVMTTPTGSGKTTLSSLKIAATLAAKKCVLYLAPTHALVSQIERDLNQRLGNIEKATSIEDISLDDDVKTLPAISVVTPERCFALLTFAPEIFENVGLLVFDECHLLGAANKGATVHKADRRSIDAMLCLLTFVNVNYQSDLLLLSAMINNGRAVAEWLQNLLGRPVFTYENKWKPTRQLRSCVVYSYTDLTLLEHGLRGKPVRGAPPPAAIPYGIFSLVSGWNPDATDKLVIKSLSPTPVPLDIGKSKWGTRYLTANRNGVAAAIALRLALQGMKVIVFCGSIDSCSSIASEINESFAKLIPSLNPDQARWKAETLTEVGGTAAIYDSGERCAAVHHGELLPAERRLVESLFKDKASGVNVLAATSTLAQGLNLPCEAVVIAGTDRLDDSDPDEKKRTPLLAHEILNAIGRAGRAGQAAIGLSIIVPGKPTTCELESKIFNDERDLAITFAAGDQCLPLTDPLTTLFDQIETGAASGPEAQYLLRRLAVSLRTAHDAADSFESLARKTFGFYEKNRSSSTASEKWLSERKVALEGALASVVNVSDVDWIEELAAKTGISSGLVRTLVENYDSAPTMTSDAEVWLSWLFDLLNHEDESCDIFLRPETIIRVFGRAITVIPDTPTQRSLGKESVRFVMKLWFSGKTLLEMEKEIATWIVTFEGTVKRPTKPHKKVKRARRFVLRIVPDVAFLCGVLVQVGQKIAEADGKDLPRILKFLPQLVRHGFPTPYHYAFNAKAEISSRVTSTIKFENIRKHVLMNPFDDWSTIAHKVDTAIALAAFGDHST